VARSRLRPWSAPAFTHAHALGVIGLVLAAGFLYGCTRLARASLRYAAGPPLAASNLPSLPRLPDRFDGVPLSAYVRPPAVTEAQMDALLTSPVMDDVEFARAVFWWREYWEVSAVRWFPGFLERMDDRGAAVDRALASAGFPPSLRYLPLIESGYDPQVTSTAGAVGMWQLMPGTARDMGLSVGPLHDERHHPGRSTTAAMRYLASLQQEFDSWFLVLAAYNSGPARVRSILRRHAPDEPRTDSLFWALRDRFPRETREFVPKLYGAMWVASRPEAYGYDVP